MNALSLYAARHAEQERRQGLDDRILCCTVAGCLSGGTAGEGVSGLRVSIQEQIERQGRAGKVEVCGTGCMGLCCEGPLVRSSAADAILTNATPADAASLVAGDWSRFGERVLTPEHLFFAGQRRVILGNSGRADPERIADYIAEGGYLSLLRAATEMAPEEIIAEVKKSRLRTRWRGVSGRSQMGTGRASELTRQVRRVQCRRGRSGRVYEPQRPGGRSAPGAGRNGHRGPGRRRATGIHLRARRVAPGHRPSPDRA